MRRLSRTLLVVIPFAAAACESGDGAGGNSLTVAGAVTGSNVPDRGRAFVVWSVATANPDYAFKFGQGESSGGRYTIGPLREPPAEALNRFFGDARIGLGFVVLAGPDVSVPDGVLADSDLQKLFGFSTRHVVIWKKGEIVCSGDPDCAHWLDALPQGFSCGRCVPAKTPGTFDTFEKAACTDVTVETATDPRTLRGCNWS